MSGKQIESRVLLSPAPIDIQKVTGDNSVFNLTVPAAPAAASLTSKRMKQPTQLTTLDLEMAIDSGKTLIGQLSDQAMQNIT